MHSVIKSKDQFKKQRNDIKISTKPKSIYGGQLIQCKASDYSDIKNIENIKTKIQEEIKYFQRMITFLYDNDIEFLIDIKFVNPEFDTNGNFICKIISYNFADKTNIQNIKSSLEYTILICGYISERNDINKDVQEWIGRFATFWFLRNSPNFNQLTNKQFEPPGSNKIAIKDDNNVALNVDINPLEFWKHFLKLIKTNGIKCGISHSKQYQKIVIFTNTIEESIKNVYRNEIDNTEISEIKSKFKNISHQFENYPIAIDNNTYYIIYYRKPIIDIEKEYFNLCNNTILKDNNQFKFIFNNTNLIQNQYNDIKNKFINLNKLKTSNMEANVEKQIKKINTELKTITVNIMNKFVENDKKSNFGNKLLFISHNIQNKNGKETNDENSFEGVGITNIFRQYSEMLFGKKNIVDHDSSMHSTKAFQFTQSMVILLQETNWLAIDTTIYGKGDVYYVNCDVANGSLFLYGKTVYGYNTFRSLEKQKSNTSNIYNHVDIDTIGYQKDNISKNMKYCKKLYMERYKQYKNKKTIIEGGNRSNKRTRDDITSVQQSKTTQKSKRFKTGKNDFIDKSEYINNYIQNVIYDLKNENVDFESLRIKYFGFFDYLRNFENLPSKQHKKNEENPFLNSIFLYPQFKLNYIDFEQNHFEGKIMVHDLTDWFEEGLTENNLVFGKVSIKSDQRLFAISCDERMNFTNSLRNADSRNNKTKQLCTIFSSEFFDPREKQDETHVLLIGIGVAGPTKNHVAMVIANKTFEEVVINVHLESAGQGDKTNSNEYALAELDVLLNCILGNNIHPFFIKHKKTIKTIRIFSDFNLLSNVIAERLKKFKIKKSFKDFKFNMLLDGVKTHDNVKKKDGSASQYITDKVNIKKVNSGCIDNVIYITKVKSIQNNIEKCIIGERKLPSETYTKEQYNSLSDHSPMIIIEDMPSDNTSFNNKNYNKSSPNIIDIRTKKLSVISENPSKSSMSVDSDSQKNKKYKSESINVAKTNYLWYPPKDPSKTTNKQ